MKVKDAVKFLFDNREDKFKEWNFADATVTIEQAIQEGTFAWSQNQDGQITGIAIGFKKENTIHVSAILIKRPARLAQFIEYFRRTFPGYKLTGNRNNKLIDFRRIYGRL